VNRTYVLIRLLSLALTACAAGACSPPAGHGRPLMVSRAPHPALVVKPDSARPAPGSALAPVDEAWVEATLREMTLRQKAGQMVLAWIDGRYRGEGPGMERLYDLVRREGVGGFIISIGTPQEFTSKLNALQQRARVPLLMVTDLESGPGMRLEGTGTDIPPVMGLAATGSDSLAFEVGRVIGEEARAVGLHLTLSPVLDVNSNPRNPIINTRSFGEDPVTVGRFAGDYIRGLHAGGLLAMGKHFPGHGDTHADSHLELPRLDRDRAALNAIDLPPFRAAIAAGMDGVLVAHIAVPRVSGDEIPSSINPKVAGDILRGEMGFRGLVATDAMNMRGLTRQFGQGDAAVRAILAGADILLQPTEIPQVLDAIERAVADGRISRERIDTSVRRILAAKTRVRLQHGSQVDPAAVASRVGTAEHRGLAAEVARRSITLVRDRRNLLPVAATRVLSLTYSDGNAAVGQAFAAALGGPGRQVTTLRLGDGTGAAEYARIRARADSAEVIVVSAYVTPHEYRGSVEAGSGFSAFVESLARAGKPVVVISFGSPYLLRDFPSVPAYLVAWGRDAVSQEAAAQALLGRAAIGGRLPVGLGADAPRGSGLQRPARVP
jgi:beta-N-acetylhexosaminidase